VTEGRFLEPLLQSHLFEETVAFSPARVFERSPAFREGISDIDLPGDEGKAQGKTELPDEGLLPVGFLPPQAVVEDGPLSGPAGNGAIIPGRFQEGNGIGSAGHGNDDPVSFTQEAMPADRFFDFTTDH